MFEPPFPIIAPAFCRTINQVYWHTVKLWMVLSPAFF